MGKNTTTTNKKVSLQIFIHGKLKNIKAEKTLLCSVPISFTIGMERS